MLVISGVAAFAADVTFSNLAPTDSDSALVLQQKTIAAINATGTAITNLNTTLSAAVTFTNTTLITPTLSGVVIDGASQTGAVGQVLMRGTNLVYWTTVGTEQEAYSAGTVYSLTATAALLDFGTTDPSITVTVAGTYMIYWGAYLKDNGATFAANRTVTIKIRRTNNTVADITNASLAIDTGTITAITGPLAVVAGKPVKYVAAAGDILQVWGSVSVIPTAGSLDANDAWILIVRIQ